MTSFKVVGAPRTADAAWAQLSPFTPLPAGLSASPGPGSMSTWVLALPQAYTLPCAPELSGHRHGLAHPITHRRSPREELRARNEGGRKQGEDEQRTEELEPK
jgi:hypothetical protein